MAGANNAPDQLPRFRLHNFDRSKWQSVRAHRRGESFVWPQWPRRWHDALQDSDAPRSCPMIRRTPFPPRCRPPTSKPAMRADDDPASLTMIYGWQSG